VTGKSRRILAALYHSCIDTSSGAAISLRDLVEALARRDWDARVFCGPLLDFDEGRTNRQLLEDEAVAFEVYDGHARGEDFSVFMFRKGNVDCALYTPRQAQQPPSQAVGENWLQCYAELLASWRPDVVITYGGFWMTRPLVQLAKEHGARIVFYLCNFAYSDGSLFDGIDATIVLSRFHARWCRECRETLGIECHPVYPLIDRERVECEADPKRRYVTFVNPQPHKGVFVVARIAEVLGRERPDIPLLVVESRAASHWIGAVNPALAGSGHLFRMTHTPDPRDYYRASRVVLMPSLWQESFGRVAAEAMINGIPVLGSTRGALPEVIGDAELLIQVPEKYTPESRQLPTADEVRPWIGAIQSLLDDAPYYRQVSDRCRLRLEMWAPEKLVAEFERIASND
jgi:glycosyltransferase involved in cell wall biosynthesis